MSPATACAWRVTALTVIGDRELVFEEPTQAQAAKRRAILERQGFVVLMQPVLWLVVDNTRPVQP